MNTMPGAHWLAFLGSLKTGDAVKLTDAVKLAASTGAEMFELACNPINQMSAEETATAILAGGMREVSFCRFFPGDLSLGDPLGSEAEATRALQTAEEDAVFIHALRKNGVQCKYVTGPNGFMLGKKYSLSRETRSKRFQRHYREFNAMFVGLGMEDVRICIEYLRKEEDCGAIGSMTQLLHFIREIGEEENVGVHFDVFHSLCRGEKPHEAILLAGESLFYVHAHGKARLYPGAFNPIDPDSNATDSTSWHTIGLALQHVQYEGPIVPEPFGDPIRTELKVLGEGLPPAIPGAEYYTRAFHHLRRNGIIA